MQNKTQKISKNNAKNIFLSNNMKKPNPTTHKF